MEFGKDFVEHFDNYFGLDNCNEEILSMTLDDIGIPVCHVVGVVGKDGKYKYYDLHGDKVDILKSMSIKE